MKVLKLTYIDFSGEKVVIKNGKVRSTFKGEFYFYDTGNNNKEYILDSERMIIREYRREEYTGEKRVIDFSVRVNNFEPISKELKNACKKLNL